MTRQETKTTRSATNATQYQTHSASFDWNYLFSNISVRQKLTHLSIMKHKINKIRITNQCMQRVCCGFPIDIQSGINLMLLRELSQRRH